MESQSAFGSGSTSDTNGGLLGNSLLENATLSTSLEDNSAYLGLSQALREGLATDPLATELDRLTNSQLVTPLVADLSIPNISPDYNRLLNENYNYDNLVPRDFLTGSNENTPLVGNSLLDSLTGARDQSLLVNSNESIPSNNVVLEPGSIVDSNNLTITEAPTEQLNTSSPVIGIDLKAISATAPVSASLNETIAVSWTVINQGNITASADWYDKIYLSDDTTWDSTDLYLSDQGTGFQTLLAGGSRYSTNQNITIPSTIIGDRYLLFVVDKDNNQSETDETNNVYATPIKITAPDLELESVVAPVAAEFNQAIDVTWTVSNPGTAEVTGRWNDRIWLSVDNILSSDDNLLLTQLQNSLAPLMSGSQYTSNASVTVKFNNVLSNEIEANDSISSANDLSPNFTLNGTNTYIAEVNGAISDAVDADYFRIFAAPGDVITVEQFGSPSGQGTLSDSYIFLYDRNGTVISQDDDSGTGYDSALTYTVPVNAYFGDYYIRSDAYSSQTGTYKLKTTLQTPNLIKSQPAEGTYYIIVQSDALGEQTEFSETNNTNYSNPLTLTLSSSKPDLAISSSTTQTLILPGATIPVEWTVTNQSADFAALGDWYDGVYISNDAVLDNSDTSLAVEWTGIYTPLAPNDSYTVKRNITLPNITGSYYLLFATDRNNSHLETDETNNVAAVAINGT